jgi:hypothetical protein
MPQQPRNRWSLEGQDWSGTWFRQTETPQLFFRTCWFGAAVLGLSLVFAPRREGLRCNYCYHTATLIGREYPLSDFSLELSNNGCSDYGELTRAESNQVRDRTKWNEQASAINWGYTLGAQVAKPWRMIMTRLLQYKTRLSSRDVLGTGVRSLAILLLVGMGASRKARRSLSCTVSLGQAERSPTPE